MTTLTLGKSGGEVVTILRCPQDAMVGAKNNIANSGIILPDRRYPAINLNLCLLVPKILQCPINPLLHPSSQLLYSPYRNANLYSNNWLGVLLSTAASYFSALTVYVS